MTRNTVTIAQQDFDVEDLILINEQRAASYGFLSRLFNSEIDTPMFEEVCRADYPVKTGTADVDEGYRLMAGFLGSRWESSLEELAVDYSRVFIGHGMTAYSAAYPFESVYTSEKRLLMQGARDEVLAIYKASGLNKKASWKEGEDHIALELEFQQILCCRIVESLRSGSIGRTHKLLLTQQNFLEDHLISWIPMLTADMKKFAKTDFYLGLAFLTEGFLNLDQEFLAMVLNTNLGPQHSQLLDQNQE
ncbi:MAG: molecular chaperone TorD family protein [Coriobacteriales bacterium]|nr:molecular chaperone TorD family protein [Coriobacteriales bacterium]